MKNNQRNKGNKTSNKNRLSKNSWFIGSAFIAILILAIYSPTFKYDFVNWDDDVNVYENRNVINFDVRGIFSDHVIGNYNPLTILTFALEYKIVKESPKWYHINNVLLHIICTLLVLVLMRRLGLSFFVSFLVAILFSIHPMRVESVAWVTERKDVLFSLFYLLTLLLYISYKKTRKWIFYFLCILTFILSLLSKIQAVSLPFSLLLIDYWLNNQVTLKSVLNKAPFFLLSLVTGLVGIYFLRQQGSLDTGESLPIFQRFFIGSYSFIVYIIKSIVPWQMTAVYPYPAKVTALHYLSMLPALAILLISLITWKSMKNLTFGILFFTLNVVFVLQVVGAGQGFTADRFTYIPYIGLFLVYAVFIERTIKKYPKFTILLYSFVGSYLLALSVLSYRQIAVWENSETLWLDVIKEQPTVSIAYKNLGHYYHQKNEYEMALKYYNTAINLEPEKPKTYNNRGKIYFDRKQYDLALEDYNKCLDIDPGYSDALANRGAVFGIRKEFDKALEDLTMAIQIDSNNVNAWSNRGFVYFHLKEFEKAIADCTIYLHLKPNDADITNLLGLCYANLKDYDNAIQYYNKSIQLNSSNPVFYLNRSFVFNDKGDKTNALKDALQAQKMGFQVNPAYLEMLNKQ